LYFNVDPVENVEGKKVIVHSNTEEQINIYIHESVYQNSNNMHTIIVTEELLLDPKGCDRM
jgi:hypothetical protein